jgi:HPt (histidine-containing phosphotransfer) domain-containing protein
MNLGVNFQEVESLLHSEFLGDIEFFAETVAVLIETLSSTFAEMISAANAPDFELVKTLAHRLKGSASTFNLEAIQKCAAKLERECQAMSGEDLVLKIQNMQCKFDGLAEHLIGFIADKRKIKTERAA